MGKFLRFIAILFLSISALFNIAGGAGTTCVALNPTNYPGYEAIARVQWLYFIFVIGTLAFGVMMVNAVILLVRGNQKGYRSAVTALSAAILLGVTHILVSRTLRGGSMPVDGVVYATVLTLIIFLILRIPGIWERVDFTKAGKTENNLTGGAAAIVVGLISLTIQHWMAPTHTIGGINYGDAFHLTTTGIGWGMTIIGLSLIVQTAVSRTPVGDPAQDKINA